MHVIVGGGGIIVVISSSEPLKTYLEIVIERSSTACARTSSLLVSMAPEPAEM